MLYYSFINHVALAVSNTNTLMLTIADGHRVKTLRHASFLVFGNVHPPLQKAFRFVDVGGLGE